jgi:hypothetical protein
MIDIVLNIFYNFKQHICTIITSFVGQSYKMWLVTSTTGLEILPLIAAETPRGLNGWDGWKWNTFYFQQQQQ